MFYLSFLYNQLIRRLPIPSGSYSGKTVIVTGSNVGLGKEAATHFARLNASKVILAVRNLEKGATAKKDIEETTKCAADVIQVWEIDMANYNSVKKFAARVESELDRVDIFIANAGVTHLKYQTAEDNEAIITVNVVSTFLLAALLLPTLKSTASKYGTRPTLTIVSSEAHEFTNLPQKSAPEGELFKSINDEQSFKKYKNNYEVSKLIEILMVREIGERHPAAGFPVTVNCLNPGFCSSEFGREYPLFSVWIFKYVLARTSELGSRTLVHGGSSGANTHGEYLSNCEITLPSAFVRSAEGKIVQKRVWNELLLKLDAIEPGVSRNLLDG
ncbi:hypothetical protein HK098_005895 [Nowakowskiella sp. JEL0407]|nr:hypothetical protein HK098_005895 [Nowakowskiella sp. JEL0407]